MAPLLLLLALLLAATARAQSVGSLADDWRNFSAVVRVSGGCPPSRTLAYGCLDAREIKRSCVIGGDDRAVPALPTATLAKITGARSSDACTNAFFSANWSQDHADFSNLRLTRVLAFSNLIKSLCDCGYVSAWLGGCVEEESKE